MDERVSEQDAKDWPYDREYGTENATQVLIEAAFGLEEEAIALSGVPARETVPVESQCQPNARQGNYDHIPHHGAPHSESPVAGPTANTASGHTLMPVLTRAEATQA